MKKVMDYLKEGLESALKEVEHFQKKIKEEERRTTKFEVRVIVETKSLEEGDWRRIVLSYHELTLDQRDRLIVWLRNI